ncbi:MAG: NADH-quinone oxidoreductase subunit NuoF [Myxococcales bacterium]|nr:NADH-quinone oxidoreductase subunit NuoF [Myxococcales bacterium]
MSNTPQQASTNPAALPSAVPFEPVLSRHFGHPQSHTIAYYESHGGYETARAFVGTPAADITQKVKDAGLRGRGGAGFPTGMKWGFLAKNTGKPTYLAVNGDESEPGTFKDRYILELDPHQLVEGVILASYAIGCQHAFIYLRGEFILGFERLCAAVAEARARGYVGPNIFGKGYDLQITIVRGAGAYICGEETGMLSSIEGGRGYPKVKPPFPAVSGLFGCPTIVNNVETICNVTHILKHGPSWFRQWGTEKSPGYKLFCVSGDVVRPGLVEVPLATPLSAIINEHCGGVAGKSIKAVIPGGSSAPLIKGDKVADVTMDYECLAAHKSMLGSGAITVMNETRDIVSAIYNLMRFYHHESCGQCTPCREGTGWLEKLMHKFHHGHGAKQDIDLVWEITRNMQGKTICVLADAAVMPMQSYLSSFPEEFQAKCKG